MAIHCNLVSRSAGRPRKVRTLSNSINALFLKSLEALELASLVKALQKQGHISIEDDNVIYHFPDAP